MTVDQITMTWGGASPEKPFGEELRGNPILMSQIEVILEINTKYDLGLGICARHTSRVTVWGNIYNSIFYGKKKASSIIDYNRSGL